ncbi:class I SAM-dependent methyltransferase [Paenibacillus psychroresistens]|uniref:Class I SAM-dependent methyltransferase n=1 Tax=Paenibacillus psychroresistens TaxID=1778678 RepID=A0A6B8RIG6_9BACL|nr:class I SAM-dependent methyltransferase [Paenibacillus psychroresistens]QGQ95677.1 class I SAM-dependent methyltransferase [Paenibacillus psychroresistens]
MSYTKFAYYYDRLMDNLPYTDWLRFMDTCWERYGKPKTIVDLGCGTGSLAIPLAQNGLQVTGIDLSEDMLAVAQNKSQGIPGGLNIAWVQQDMREWELHEQVDAAVSFCDCLNYITEEDEIVQAFRQTYQGLKSGGLFIFDVHTPFTLISYAATQPFFMNEEDIAYIWTSELEDETCEICHELTLFVREDDGKSSLSKDRSPQESKFLRFEETHVQRGYRLDWLKRQLLDIGFIDVECFGDFRFEPVHAETERAFFVCHKP